MRGVIGSMHEQQGSFRKGTKYRMFSAVNKRVCAETGKVKNEK